MNKESTRTIYNCLGMAFWTKRQCLRCQQAFSPIDWEKKNYQLFFKEIGDVRSNNSLNQAVLVGVIVELQHGYCPLTCGFNYQSEIICQQSITIKRK